MARKNLFQELAKDLNQYVMSGRRLGLCFLLMVCCLMFNQAHATELTVYKSPTCGCCQKWIDYLAENNLQSKVVDMQDMHTVKTDLGIQGRYRSCHTGVVVTEKGDYVFEGHVPAEHIKEFLNAPPENALGLSVPGMPIGSPGMEVGDRNDYYQVLVIFKDGSSEVFAHVNQG